jgi:serine phosphatase RsbU (regulator of sigma subunit)
VERERITREMEIAREVQERLFPQRLPAIEGISLAGGVPHRECTGASVTLWTGDIRYKSLAELRA